MKIARLYYEQDMTQAEISNQLRLSRQKVQRVLNEARESGIVTISIHPVSGIFYSLEKALEHAFHLSEAIVIEGSNPNDQDAIAREIGGGAADYMTRLVRPGDKVVVSWGHSLLGMVNALGSAARNPLRNVKVIQGLGGLGNPNAAIHGAELIRRTARALGAQPILLPAPAVAASEAVRDAICSDPYVAHVLEMARTADLAFVGIGSSDRDAIALPALLQYLPESLWSRLKEGGAVGSINLHYFDVHGQPVLSEIDGKIIGLSLDELRKIPRVVGVAGGFAKIRAIRATLQAELLDVLVTDHLTAEALLKTTEQSSTQE